MPLPPNGLRRLCSCAACGRAPAAGVQLVAGLGCDAVDSAGSPAHFGAPGVWIRDIASTADYVTASKQLTVVVTPIDAGGEPLDATADVDRIGEGVAWRSRIATAPEV